jgi:Asp-tRNA(Asn)/Glu-tRNA(Gln) amidotransferase A subunit family amidase
MDANPAFWSLARQAEAIRSGRVRIPDLLGLQRRQVATLNPRYRAFSYVDEPGAGTAARELQAALDAGQDRGALHGVSVSVKGNLPVAGLPWTEGSALYRGRVATHDAALVARVRRAGGIVLGTTTLSELAMYAPDNPAEPLALNPWDEARTSGGSSAGAAVAAVLGMAVVNVGTDAGGSVRNPACHCGAVGFMATLGALSLAGTPNYAPSLGTAGLIARTVGDIAAAFQVLRDTPGVPVRLRHRLLVPRRLVDDRCDEASLTLFATAVDRLRAAFAIEDVDLDGWLEAERGAGVVSLTEAGAGLAGLDVSRLGPALRRRVDAAARLAAREVRDARAACAAFESRLAKQLRAADADAVLTPTWPFPAPPIHAESVAVRGHAVPVDPHRNSFVRVANAARGCAITLPSGVYPAERVPAGVQLLAPGGADDALLAAAALAEGALPDLPAPPPAIERTG